MGFGKESPIPKSREDCPAAKIMTCMPPLSTKVAALRQPVVRPAIFSAQGLEHPACHPSLHTIELETD
jgi:hypothetical protein